MDRKIRARCTLCQYVQHAVLDEMCDKLTCHLRFGGTRRAFGQTRASFRVKSLKRRGLDGKILAEKIIFRLAFQLTARKISIKRLTTPKLRNDFSGLLSLIFVYTFVDEEKSFFDRAIGRTRGEDEIATAGASSDALARRCQ